MKKRILGIVTALVIAGMMLCQTAFAAGTLELVSAFPEDGKSGYEIMNQYARLVFSGAIDVEQNKEYFKVEGPEGKEEPVRVLEEADQPERVNLLFENQLVESTEYTIIIDGALSDVDGNTLGEDVTITFKTKSMKRESLITTVMMFVMMGVIIVMTFREQAKQQRQQQSDEKQKVNPYKEAKKEAEKKVSQRKKNRKEAVEAYQKEIRRKQEEKEKAGKNSHHGQEKNKKK